MSRHGWWTERVVPRLVDASLGNAEIGRRRHIACQGLHGRVLEVGFGSGLNLPYLPAEVSAVDAVEPSDLAWERSEARRAEADGVTIARVGLDGTRIDVVDASYEAALITFSLCTIPDPAQALAEVHRALRGGGTLHVLEHGLAPTERTRRWQRRLEPVQRAVAGGCHLTRDPVALITAAGFRIDDVEHEFLGGGPARPWTYLTRLSATLT